MEKDTRQKIIKEAGSLFAAKGYFGVSMQEVADGLGITKAALYYHFESKKQLFLAVAEQTFTGLLTRLATAVGKGRNPAESLLNLVDQYLSFTLKNPGATLLYSEGAETADEEIRQFLIKTQRRVATFFRQAFNKVAEDEKRQAELIRHLSEALVGFLSSPRVQGKTRRDEKISQIINDVFLAPIRGDPPLNR